LKPVKLSFPQKKKRESIGVGSLDW
jgi:hypothetical protein